MDSEIPPRNKGASPRHASRGRHVQVTATGNRPGLSKGRSGAVRTACPPVGLKYPRVQIVGQQPAVRNEEIRPAVHVNRRLSLSMAFSRSFLAVLTACAWIGFSASPLQAFTVPATPVMAGRRGALNLRPSVKIGKLPVVQSASRRSVGPQMSSKLVDLTGKVMTIQMIEFHACKICVLQRSRFGLRKCMQASEIKVEESNALRAGCIRCWCCRCERLRMGYSKAARKCWRYDHCWNVAAGSFTFRAWPEQGVWRGFEAFGRN
jgi:hypothetical protein